jgi:hypothetical protein
MPACMCRSAPDSVVDECALMRSNLHCPFSHVVPVFGLNYLYNLAVVTLSAGHVLS